jgi:hypothetical protein
MDNTFEDIPVSNVLSAFKKAVSAEAQANVKEVVEIFIEVAKEGCEKDAKPNTFLEAREYLKSEIDKGYSLKRVYVTLKEFNSGAGKVTCSLHLLGNGRGKYALWEDMNHDPPECQTSCSFSQTCKAFYASLTARLNKRF